MFKLNRVDNGNCRVYYSKPSGRLFCFQLGHRRGSFDFMACTKSGEPEYEVSFVGKDFDKMPGSETSIGREFLEWAEKVSLVTPSASPSP